MATSGEGAGHCLSPPQPGLAVEGKAAHRGVGSAPARGPSVLRVASEGTAGLSGPAGPAGSVWTWGVDLTPEGGGWREAVGGGCGLRLVSGGLRAAAPARLARTPRRGVDGVPSVRGSSPGTCPRRAVWRPGSGPQTPGPRRVDEASHAL